MRRYVFFLVICLAGVLALPAACGGDSTGTDDGSADGTLGGDSPFNGDGGPSTDGNGGSDSTLFGDGNPNCTPLGNACTVSGDCCSGNCNGGSCHPPTCTGDNQACSTNAQCCSGTCANGTCTPLNSSCKTLGNPCTGGNECCSLYCANGVCSAPSYCGQNGDICAKGSDCCGGVCTIAQNNTFGTCGQPSSGGCTIDGMLCGGTTSDGGVIYTDGGLPQCGGECCSRDCAPWGPTKVLICQPASGCHPVGDICHSDNDCCGGNGGGKKDAGVTVCIMTNGVGVCSNPTGCKPNGDICRLQTNQCNATENCCSGNVQQFNTCHQDNLGVPRCSYAGDAGCVPTSGACATSADCCDLNPCVNGVCGGGCVKCGGACTTTADCCAGGQCNSQGTCDCPDGGGCALYGQECGDAGSLPCCNNVPCTLGRCEVPVN